MKMLDESAAAATATVAPPTTGDAVAQRPGRPVPANQRRILWTYTVPIIFIHLAACAAAIPWLFTWTGLIVSLLGVHIYGQAINLAYHRMFSHRSFRVPRWLERWFVIMALGCLQDTPGRWVATHRLHHNHSDDPPDPHTPRVSLWWAHVGWLFEHNPATHNLGVYRKYASDILSDPFYMRLEKQRWLPIAIYLAHGAAFVAAGALAGWLMTRQVMGAVQMGLSLLVWGVFVRTVIVWHITWSVNSLTHAFGYRNYETGEGSRNNWLVALLTVGEGWHNNHHHDPASASVQHRWWEVDISYYQIKLLERLGLATDVRAPRHKRQARKASVAND